MQHFHKKKIHIKRTRKTHCFGETAAQRGRVSACASIYSVHVLNLVHLILSLNSITINMFQPVLYKNSKLNHGVHLILTSLHSTHFLWKLSLIRKVINNKVFRYLPGGRQIWLTLRAEHIGVLYTSKVKSADQFVLGLTNKYS